MNTRNFSLMAVAILLLSLAMTACSKSEDNDSSKQEEAPYIKAANTDITANAGAQVLEQAFDTNIEGAAPRNFEATSNEEWCTAAILDRPCRLQLSLTKNEAVSERKAVVTVTSTKYNVALSFNITQKANAPVMKFSNNNEGKNQRIAASSNSWSWTLQSNLPYNDIEVQSNETWCQVELANDEVATGMKSYQLTTNISDNMSATKREATVTISSKSYGLSTSFKVTQSGSTMTISNKKLAFDRDGGNREVTIKSDAAWQAECTADWITLEQNDGSLTIRTTSTTDDRTAQVTFKDRESTAITITQTKYKVGDAYDEDGVTGTVGYIGDEKRFIFKQLDEELQYRQYDDAGQEGATDMDDGRKNTLTVLRIVVSKDKKYPAFQAANRLNIGDATGWYLPAINELALMKSFITSSAWSSTEAYVLSAYSHNGSSTQIINKTKKLTVYAIKQF